MWFCFILYFVRRDCSFEATFLFIIWWLLAGQRDQNLNITLFNTNTGNLPHVEFLNPCALKGRCVQGLIPHRRSKRSPYAATQSTLHYVYMPRVPGAMVGIEGFTSSEGGEVGGALDKNEMRVIGLNRVWFKLRRLGSEFSVIGEIQPCATGLLLHWTSGQQLRNSQHASRPERILENDFQW